MDERVECCIQGCLKPPAALLSSQFYCRGHFVATCYARLDFCADLLRNRSVTDHLGEEMRKFVSECTLQAAKLSETANNLNNIERARLLDILFYASDLSTLMRRSPRKALSFPVRIHCNTPGAAWKQETVSRVVSRLGGMFECQHTLKSDDVIVVEHLDTGRSVNARLAWGWRAKSGSFVVGLEFLNCNNFWGLDWSEPDTDPATSQTPQAEPLSSLQPVPKNAAP